MNGTLWAAVLGMFVATYAVRASFIVFGQRLRFPPSVVQALGHFVGGSGRVQLQFIEAAAQAAQVEVAQVQGAVVEEYSAAQGHGAGSWGVV